MNTATSYCTCCAGICRFIAATNPDRASSQCAVSDSHPEIGFRARITVRKDGVVTKVVEVRLPPEADDAA